MVFNFLPPLLLDNTWHLPRTQSIVEWIEWINGCFFFPFRCQLFFFLFVLFLFSLTSTLTLSTHRISYLPPFLSLSHLLTPSMRVCVCVCVCVCIISSLQRRKQKFKSLKLATFRDHTSSKRYVADVMLPQIPWPFFGALIHTTFTPSHLNLRLCPRAAQDAGVLFASDHGEPEVPGV